MGIFTGIDFMPFNAFERSALKATAPYFFKLSSHTISTDISDGDTPEILDACPSDFGCI